MLLLVKYRVMIILVGYRREFGLCLREYGCPAWIRTNPLLLNLKKTLHPLQSPSSRLHPPYLPIDNSVLSNPYLLSKLPYKHVFAHSCPSKPLSKGFRLLGVCRA